MILPIIIRNGFNTEDSLFLLKCAALLRIYQHYKYLTAFLPTSFIWHQLFSWSVMVNTVLYDASKVTNLKHLLKFKEKKYIKHVSYLHNGRYIGSLMHSGSLGKELKNYK